MIVDMTKDIVQLVVEANTELNWVASSDGIPNISANKLPAAYYPAISVYEVDNYPEQYADDEEQSSYLSFQINLFSKNGSHKEVQNLIDKKMKQEGFLRIEGPPFQFDDKTNVGQKILMYAQEIEI